MKKDTEKEKWWAMNREERLRRQKDFLTGFAFWVVWLVILWVVLKAAGSVLFPFLAAFAVAVLLSGAVQFIAERMHIQRGIVAVAVVLFFYIILAVFLYFAGSYLVRLIYDTARELSVFFSDTIVPVMQRFYQWLDRFVSVFYPTELTGKTSGLHGVGEESAQTLKNAGKLMSGISDGVIDGVSGMAAGIPGFFMKLLITVIATVFMELEFPQIRAFFKAADSGGIPACVPGWKKLCDRDDGKMHYLLLSDLRDHVCGTCGRTVFTWHKKCICHRVYHCSA
ncbi:Predicted permease [Roseburia intestinalis XB6B4]|uniref:Predicted permease n=1 Tax=Roseburia intestinalis XB6B4 TaxID=718255 RepID=D4KZM6_9FIRM|nr:Predicted permease [Roseburia intestinalis XB6B4]